ncbi:MAG: 2-hydroxymuconate tautomerase [Janthinobacterium lividum]
MPIARISIMDGRTDAQKAHLIAAVSDAIHESLGAPYEAIRVLLEEVPRTQWGIGGKTAIELGKT